MIDKKINMVGCELHIEGSTTQTLDLLPHFTGCNDPVVFTVRPYLSE